VVSKKTSRSPKSAAPAQSPEETNKPPSRAARAPKAAATRAPKKPALAKPAGRVVTRRKRPANEAPSVPDAGQPTIVVSDEEIRIRAYFLSLEYLGSDRDDVDFWLLAERELRPAKKSDD
jgi:hypothetical protein